MANNLKCSHGKLEAIHRMTARTRFEREARRAKKRADGASLSAKNTHPARPVQAPTCARSVCSAQRSAQRVQSAAQRAERRESLCAR